MTDHKQKRRTKVDWNEPILDESVVMSIEPTDVMDAYIFGKGVDKYGPFFVLLVSLRHYENNKRLDLSARIAYLISYYLFILFPSKCSCELSLRYIRFAVDLEPKEVFIHWRDVVENRDKRQKSSNRLVIRSWHQSRI